MKNLTPYLAFEGNCKEALHFYKDCFEGAVVTMQAYGETPHECAEADKDKIMHSEFKADGIYFMACDNMHGPPLSNDGKIGLAMGCNNEAEQEAIFNKLAVNGQITMPLADTFWGAKFGMLTDQYGISWMLNCEKAK